MNSGSGTLTAAVIKVGVNAATPDDPRNGGTDLTNTAQVETLWQSWSDLHHQGFHLIIHFAPTCSSMTRARRRSLITRVRDAEYPWGLPGLKDKALEAVHAANRLAIATDELAGKAHELLGADVSVENPEPSFIWLLGLFEWPGVQDTVFSPCMLGDDIFKPTRIKTLGIRLPSLTLRYAWSHPLDATRTSLN